MDWPNLISTIGFPIVAFGVCAWFLRYVYDKSMTMFRDSLEKIGTLAEAVNHNTEVLLKLVERMDEDEKQRTM